MARRRQVTDDGQMAAAAHLVTVILGAEQVEDHSTTEGAPAGSKASLGHSTTGNADLGGNGERRHVP